MMVEHFLQDCQQTNQKLRAETWPADTLAMEKIYQPVKNPQHIATVFLATGENDDDNVVTSHTFHFLSS